MEEVTRSIKINPEKKKCLMFLGRNGWCYLSGIVVSSHLSHMTNRSHIHLTPINSKDRWGACHIELPLDRETVDELISVLEEIKTKNLEAEESEEN